MYLPYWDSEIDVEVGRLAFSNRGRGALTLAGLHSDLLKKLSAYALSLNSELLYLCGTNCGIAGSMIWEEAILSDRDLSEGSPFTLVFGYSREMENFVSQFIDGQSALRAGVTQCTFWNRKIPIASYKVIAFMAVLPIVNEIQSLEAMAEKFRSCSSENELVAGYAERFGFLRAPVLYETDTPRGLLMTSKLEEFQLEATRSVVGPSPSVPLPLFYELATACRSQELGMNIDEEF